MFKFNKSKNKNRKLNEEVVRAYWNKKLESTNKERISQGLEPFTSVDMMVFGSEKAPGRDISPKERLDLIKQVETREKNKKRDMER